VYIPKYAKHEDPGLVREFIESHPFATVVTHVSGLFAGHFPFLVSDLHGDLVLVSHMAKSNPQWKQIENEPTVLVIFQGPHAYVSPSIYINPMNVPTWNYTAVHAYGKARVIHELEAVESILARTVEKFESQRESPWRYDLPRDFRDKLIKAIVAFEISIERVEGKFKLSQNREPKDYEAVVREFSKLEDANSKELIRYMSRTRL
jgi:transcriptional regulator